MAADARVWMRQRGCLFWGVAIVVVAGVLGALDPTRSAPGSDDAAAIASAAVAEAAAEAAPAVVDATTRAECRDTVRQLERAGLIKGRPRAGRIDVDDRLWAEMPAQMKSRALQAVSCDVQGRFIPAGFDDEAIAAYGWRSGKRLALLTQVGVSFE